MGIPGDAADVVSSCVGDARNGEDLRHVGGVGGVDGYGAVPEGAKCQSERWLVRRW